MEKEHKRLKMDQQESNSESQSEKGIVPNRVLIPPTDIILEVEGTDIHLNKQVLMDNSDVFGAMFENEFREKYEKKIPLPGKNYDDFLEFLRIFYPPSSAPITEQTVLKIAPLADEYRVCSVTRKCESFLQEVCQKACDDKYNTIETSKLVNYVACAEKYRMKSVLPLAIRLCAEHSIRSLEEAGLYTMISQEKAKEIIESRDKMTKKEVQSSLRKGYLHFPKMIKLYWGSCYDDCEKQLELDEMLVNAFKKSKCSVDDLLDIIIAAERYNFSNLLSAATKEASKCGFEHITASLHFDKLSRSRVLDICMKRFDLVDKRPLIPIPEFPDTADDRDDSPSPGSPTHCYPCGDSTISIEKAYRFPK